MCAFELPKLKIGNLVSRLPIIQGGMGLGISMANLASAVANTGAVGVLSSVGMNMDWDDPFNNKRRDPQLMRDEIRKAKGNSNGIIGINIMRALTDFTEHLRISVEEKVDMILVGAGLFLDIPENILSARSEKGPITFLPIVSSPKAASVILRYWAKKYNRLPDGLVIEGPLAGGHLGFKREDLEKPENKLEVLLEKILPIVKNYGEQLKQRIAVIVAGGIFSGEDIFKFIKAGADGVQMGSRFVTTDECDASPEFKKAYVNCKEEDLTIIDSPVGLPGRAIKNQFLDDVEHGRNSPVTCPVKCLETCNFKEVPYCIAKALHNAKKGIFKDGFAFAGANAFRIKKIVSVKELIDSLVNEYKKAAGQTL